MKISSIQAISPTSSNALVSLNFTIQNHIYKPNNWNLLVLQISSYLPTTLTLNVRSANNNSFIKPSYSYLYRTWIVNVSFPLLLKFPAYKDEKTFVAIDFLNLGGLVTRIFLARANEVYKRKKSCCDFETSTLKRGEIRIFFWLVQRVKKQGIAPIALVLTTDLSTSFQQLYLSSSSKQKSPN